jgi:fructose/tagatose bisphosphate aldolase
MRRPPVALMRRSLLDNAAEKDSPLVIQAAEGADGFEAGRRWPEA